MYFEVVDALEELDAMRTPPETGTLRIFDMPRRSLLSKIQIEALDAFLQTLSRTQTVAVDSVSSEAGGLQSQDVAQLSKLLQQDATLEFQGGIINRCIDGAIGSVDNGIKKRGRDDIRIVVDTAPSTWPVNIEVLEPTDKLSKLSPEIAAAARELMEAKIILPKLYPTNLAEVRQWVSQNANINEKREALQRARGRYLSEKAGYNVTYR